MPNYKAKFDALLSAHYVAAAILHDRALTLAQFEPARYDDPKLRRAAAELIEVRPDARSRATTARSRSRWPTARCSSRSASIRAARSRTRSRRAQIEAKFRTYAKGVLADAQAEEVIAAVSRLEELASVRKLMDLLRGTKKKAKAA